MPFDDRAASAPASTPASADAEPTEHGVTVTGPAWLLRDVTHVPGVLTLHAGRLSFLSTRRVVFDATPDELELAPSRGRRGRFRLTVDGERLGLSVVRPSGAVPVPVDLLTRTIGVAEPGDDALARWQGLLVPFAVERPRHRPAPGGGRAPRRPEARRRPRALRALTTLVPGLRRATA